MQATCRADLRFIDVDIRCPYSMHDSVAHRMSPLAQRLEQAYDGGKLRAADGSPYFVIGDTAYVPKPWLVTSFTSQHLSMDKSGFNYYLSSMRIRIECAFGVLTQKWGILNGQMFYSLAKDVKIVALCMKLHNFCIEQKCSTVYNNPSHVTKDGSRGGGYDEPRAQAGRRHDLENSGGLRARISRSIAQAGRYRPSRSSFAQEWQDLAGPGSNPGMAGAVATMRLQGGDGDL